MTADLEFDPRLHKLLMFDTHIIDKLADTPDVLEKLLRVKDVFDIQIYWTNIQNREIFNTWLQSHKVSRYFSLNEVLERLDVKRTASESLILDFTKIGEDKLATNHSLEAIENFLGNSKNGNHLRDAVIAQSASKAEVILIADDGFFKRQAVGGKIRSVPWASFCERLLELAL